jgi:hypothetical protein
MSPVGRGRLFCEIHVESVSDLSLIEKRSSDRQAVSEMTIKQSHGLRPDLKELVQRVEAAKTGEIEKGTPTADLQQGKRITPLIEIPNQVKQAMQRQASVTEQERQIEYER